MTDCGGGSWFYDWGLPDGYTYIYIGVVLVV